ncbi:multidrug ABC transporter ATP-binding protein [Coxiella burnetii]|uniref:ABC transporter ATP-binding protein n=1 Tax=Coxiella burnetii TaxID=777 RepID=UPI000306BCE2|nr:ABC transporter ATP-binding protein [Coxiella burnetii]AML49087.1 multidrug ABC transporter ATP-binding protein [Coxiella burnetii]AML55024.1 multidrug ABC transporter ATP-binding protein [Coxiella burnetii]ATN69002.1 multidrug ABC transporter ATP-binding protein [Coxiella burnetii]ATN70921.1 multidrug ABC transporter ATP-binding protein [Coxiella burnetii]ATN72835.1 multidrug ABC transporter ATP-binding protein [Coxiella burnetii]
MNVIDAKHLNKKYGKFAALKEINFAIKRGQIVGLIGPNGAGKTTLLKSILGLTNYSGELNVLGLNPRSDRVKLIHHLCFIADVAILPRWIKVENLIEFVEGVHPNFNREKALGFLNKTNIKMHQKVKELSKGMIVQLHLALVMAIDVEILVLDEPTLGLDILYRKNFFHTILNDYYNEKRTIIIATHQVEEIESILTNLIMIDRGELLLESSMEEIAERFTEVRAMPDQAQFLQPLKPIFESKEIGRVRFIFENVDKNELEKYGEITVPSISYIFVAKIKENL